MAKRLVEWNGFTSTGMIDLNESAGYNPADRLNFVGQTWASNVKIDVDFGKYFRYKIGS